ncbi:MAG: T9SS type A sorting domain-containing protein [Chitinophagaceae bacterium]
MKIHLLFAIIFLSFSIEGSAQKIRFMDTTNRWVEIVSGGGTDYSVVQNIIRLQGDTTIDSHSYKKMQADVRVLFHYYGYSYNDIMYLGGPYFFREDTAQQMVYGRMAKDTIETVIYNAAWQVGDTAFHLINVPLQANEQYYVSSIDSVDIGGVSHKVFRFKAFPSRYANGDALIVIEGIGCTYGPFFPIYPNPGFEYGIQLSCFHQGMATPALSATLISETGELHNSFDNATSCTLAVNDFRHIEGITLTPNPGNSTMILKFQTPLSAARLTIYNSFGQVVAQKSFANQLIIPIGRMLSVAGDYFYKVDDLQKGGIATGKFAFYGE